MRRVRRYDKAILAGVTVAAGMVATGASAAPDFPPFDKVSEGYEKVVSTADGQSLYAVWIREKDGQMLAELPRGYERQHHFFAMTTPNGEIFAGLQGGDLYVYWKRYDDRLAIIAPNLAVTATGDRESKDSVDTIFTDTVLLDVPIVCTDTWA